MRLAEYEQVRSAVAVPSTVYPDFDAVLARHPGCAARLREREGSVSSERTRHERLHSALTEPATQALVRRLGEHPRAGGESSRARAARVTPSSGAVLLRTLRSRHRCAVSGGCAGHATLLPAAPAAGDTVRHGAPGVRSGAARPWTASGSVASMLRRRRRAAAHAAAPGGGPAAGSGLGTWPLNAGAWLKCQPGVELLLVLTRQHRGHRTTSALPWWSLSRPPPAPPTRPNWRPRSARLASRLHLKLISGLTALHALRFVPSAHSCIRMFCVALM